MSFNLSILYIIFTSTIFECVIFLILRSVHIAAFSSLVFLGLLILLKSLDFYDFEIFQCLFHSLHSILSVNICLTKLKFS